MRLSKETLLEIVAIFQNGLMQGKDASQALRELDLEIGIEELVLSSDYLRGHPRATEWPNDDVQRIDGTT